MFKNLISLFFIIGFTTSLLATDKLSASLTFEDFYHGLDHEIIVGLKKDVHYWQKIYSSSNKELMLSKQMLLKKGFNWNDEETRLQLAKSQWETLLIFALQQVSENELETAKASLAMGICDFYDENQAFSSTQSAADFLWSRKDFFKNLFSENGFFKLSAPIGYDQKVKSALESIADFELISEIEEELDHNE